MKKHKHKIKPKLNNYELHDEINGWEYCPGRRNHGWCEISAPYSFYINFQPRRDNKWYYNHSNKGGSCGHCSKVRFPSLKASKKVWKNFYNLFPEYKEKMLQLVEEQGKHHDYVVWKDDRSVYVFSKKDMDHYKNTIKMKIIDY